MNKILKIIRIVIAALTAGYSQYEKTADVKMDSAGAQKKVNEFEGTLIKDAMHHEDGVKAIEALGRDSVAHADPNKPTDQAVRDFIASRKGK